MSAVIAAPELIEAAATDVAAIGSSVNAAHLTAASPTVAVLPAAADEVSTGIAHLFSQHAAGYQALAGRAAAYQEQFVQHLTAGAGLYAAAEAANVALLQPLEDIAASIGSALRDQLNNFFLYVIWPPLSNSLIGILRVLIEISDTNPFIGRLAGTAAALLFVGVIIAFGVLIYIASSLGLWPM
jgi:hypothetical protein